MEETEISELSDRENLEEETADVKTVSKKDRETVGDVEGIPQRPLIYVDVTGAVKCPGVVTVPSGARVYEAIEKAGGFLEDAAAEFVNQAAVLADGQQIRVYTRDEAADLGAASLGAASTAAETEAKAGQGKININEATAEELMTLSGIGKSKAADIIRYREENGGFKKIEDIMNISGIKEAVFSRIKDKIVTQW